MLIKLNSRVTINTHYIVTIVVYEQPIVPSTKYAFAQMVHGGRVELTLMEYDEIHRRERLNAD